MTAKDGTTEFDPASLPLEELRARRAELQHRDDAVSYVRRLAQVRLDVVRSEMSQRTDGKETDISGDLPRILGEHLTGGAARPPRPTDDFSSHPLAAELEALCDDACSTDLPSMSHEELASYAGRLHEFEQLRSSERRELFARIDALSAELVRRYRDGEANIDGLLVDD